MELLTAVGSLLWVALMLLLWRPWSTRERLEPDEPGDGTELAVRQPCPAPEFVELIRGRGVHANSIGSGCLSLSRGRRANPRLGRSLALPEPGAEGLGNASKPPLNRCTIQAGLSAVVPR